MLVDKQRQEQKKLLQAVENKDGKDHYGYPGGEPGSGDPKDPEIKKKRDKVREVRSLDCIAILVGSI